MKSQHEIITLFETANHQFLASSQSLLQSKVSERTLCGALMLCLHDSIKNKGSFDRYYVDVEYNRNKGSVKTISKTISGQHEHIIKINCDLILHSRGEHPEQDNLIAIEMKKSTRPKSEKESDKDRLKALTKDSFDDIWAYDGHSLPEHVCRYVLGVYYEIDFKRQLVKIVYYWKGQYHQEYTLLFPGMKTEKAHARNR